MLSTLILIPTTVALGLGFWRAGRARDLRWFANGVVLVVVGVPLGGLALLVAAVGG